MTIKNKIILAAFMASVSSPITCGSELGVESEQIKSYSLPTYGADYLSPIPQEMKGHIASFLSLKDIATLSQTNKINNLVLQMHYNFSDLKYFNLMNPANKYALISYLNYSQNHKVLVSLKPYLERNSEKHVNELKDILPFCNYVGSLELYDNNIRDEAVIEIAQSPYLQNLKSLNLARNKITDDGLIGLAEALKANSEAFQNLKTLILSENQIGDIGAKALCGIIPSLSKLLSLDLSFNNVSDDGVQAISNALISNPIILQNFETWDLSENNIGFEGAKAIATVIPHLSKLKDLVLSQNNIGEKGTSAIAEALSKLNSSSLVYLDLSDNNICDEGANAIWIAFNSYPNNFENLESIILAGNKISDLSVKLLTSVFKSNPNIFKNLGYLGLGCNNISDNGALEITNAFITNLSMLINLKSLDLSENNLGFVGKQALDNLKKQYPSLQLSY